MNNLIKFSLSVFLLFISTINAQEKEIAEADESFERYAYIDAREIYLEVAKDGYASADLFQKIGDSYYLNADFKNAVIWYERLVKKYKNEVSSEYLYRYSQCLKSIEEYDKSDQVMEKFDALHGKYDKRAAFFRSTRYYLDLIEKQSGKFDLDSIDFNSEYSEHSPSFDANGNLVFSSSRGGGIVFDWDKMPFLDLYSMGLNEDADKSPKLIEGDINTQVHESSAVFTKDGKTMYFTRNNYLNKKLGIDGTGITRLKLYKATLNKDKWENVEELPFNSNEYSVAHPALDASEEKLYFASDMPGSFGESDLYEVTINEDGSFGEPENLGDSINTEGKETFPFISKKGDLYFSSNGHVGLGGLDVFFAKKIEDEFSDPYNVGKPINSPSDDFSFIIENETDKGYFASNRSDGLGSDDIYPFTQTEPLDIECGLYIKGVVIDKETKQILPGAEVLLLDEGYQEVSRVTADEEGKYSLYAACNKNVIVRGQKIKYVPNQTSLELDGEEDEVVVLDIELLKTEPYTKKIKTGDDLAKLLDMNNIYFDLNKYKIRRDAEVELQKIIVLMRKYPNLKIDIRAHTDSRANDKYNMQLSKKRAYETKKYLSKKGNIEVSRILNKGYGETQLVNDCGNGVDCNEEEHEMNRRSEFIILNRNDTFNETTVSK